MHKAKTVTGYMSIHTRVTVLEGLHFLRFNAVNNLLLM
jgi:hypothetical protein